MSGAQVLLVLLATACVLLLALCGALLWARSWGRLAGLLLGLAALGSALLYAYSDRPLPERDACALPTRPGELGALCGVRKPEDLAHVPELGLIVTAEFEPGGRLMAFRLDDLAAAPVALWPTAEGRASLPSLGDPACTASPDPQAFFPHGISVAAATSERGPLLAVVTHAERDTLHLFELGAAAQPYAQWRGCIAYPPGTAGNDVALLRDGSLVATNFSPVLFGLQGWRYQMRALIGIPTGDVLRWSAASGWSHVPATGGAGPNGVIVSADETTLYFADGGRETLRARPLVEAQSAALDIDLGAPPDNLSLLASGAILATVATFDGELPLVCSFRGRECRVGWAVLEIDPDTRAVSEVVSEPGRAIATATSALEVGPYVFIGTMQDDRVGVYRRR